ncbi:TfoX/Sxy family protein [Ideonella sp. 4Y16]|uniref:TfoX/Sxy family protein n=1 Tax=Ideonella alba TaxID=2824118 RepID=A0A940YL75_9BURK|nr:TfoX/Sxy family protein [Ideonella alba]MBQ0931844.1 TfoX/Sxy family protein [Ideonella alba]MBQ0941712.1 TfoX/Sxy family protein [Ideonella alba]
MPEPDRLAELPGLGPRSAEWLRAAGIDSAEQLRRLGAVAAYAQVRARQPRASLNLLWALEGAISGLPWQQVARQHRTSLLLALEEHLRRHPPAGSAPKGQG